MHLAYEEKRTCNSRGDWDGGLAGVTLTNGNISRLETHSKGCRSWLYHPDFCHSILFGKHQNKSCNVLLQRNTWNVETQNKPRWLTAYAPPRFYAKSSWSNWIQINYANWTLEVQQTSGTQRRHNIEKSAVKKRFACLCSEPPKSKQLENHHFGSARWKRSVAFTDYGLKKRNFFWQTPITRQLRPTCVTFQFRTQLRLGCQLSPKK